MATIKQYNDRIDKEKIAYQYYINKGYSKEQALGIVGNLVYESGLRTTAIGDRNLKDNAYGVAQWRKDRFERLKSRYGNEWNKFENQLEFVDWELNNTHKKAGTLLKSATSAHEAGKIFSDEFERPKLKYNENKDRRKSVSVLAKRLEGVDLADINSQETFLRKNNDFSNFANQGQVVVPEYATLPEAEKEKETEVKQKTAEDKLEEKQKEEDFLNYVKNINKQQEQEIQPQEVATQAPQLNAIDFYNQANQIISMQGGGIITDNRGQWAHPGKITRIESPNITMKNVNYPVLGISEQTGEQKLMMPNLDYYFNNTKSILEIPLKNG